MRRSRPAEPTAGAYELRFRLERSYRPHGWACAVTGVIGFFVAIVMGDPWLFLFAGPATAGGIWLLVKDLREYLVVEPRTQRLRIVMMQGRQSKPRCDFDLREFVRLETAQYDLRPRGLRCMIVLFRADGSVEKVADRLHDDHLVSVCREAAAAVQLEFIDRGRIDKPEAAAHKRVEDESEQTVAVSSH